MPKIISMDYTKLATSQIITQTTTQLQAHNFFPILVNNKQEALEQIKQMIPKGASVMNGTSKTLEQIGFIEYLKSENHGWNNLHKIILEETDPIKQSLLRKQSTITDYYLGSAHAVTEDGQILIVSNSGSQLPSIVFNAPNIIFVVGSQKIVPNMTEALKRLEKHIMPLENERIKAIYGVNTLHAKTLILHAENPMMGRKIHVIIVNEPLGF